MVCIAAANAGGDLAGPQDRVPRRGDAARAADRPADRRGDRHDRRRLDRSACSTTRAAPASHMIGTRPLPGAAGDADGDADQGPAGPQPGLAVRDGRRARWRRPSSCAASGSLSFAVGAYLPLSTTTPIFVGGARPRARRAGARKAGGDDGHAETRARPRQPVRDRPRRRAAPWRAWRSRSLTPSIDRGARRSAALARARPHATCWARAATRSWGSPASPPWPRRSGTSRVAEPTARSRVSPP